MFLTNYLPTLLVSVAQDEVRPGDATRDARTKEIASHIHKRMGKFWALADACTFPMTDDRRVIAYDSVAVLIGNDCRKLSAKRNSGQG